MNDRIGQQLGNYRIIRLLGEGGFAEVYLGEHIHLKTKAAIKMQRTQLTDEDREQFRREAQTVANLDHPNIVRVLEFGVEGDTLFLVMNYASNGSLRQCHPRDTILPIPTVVSYVKQVADALQFAHDQKLIHQDVKPENMLVGTRNEVLLTDFGLAIVVRSTRSTNIEDKSVAGTALYMAPEQFRNKPCPASDQYSLGVAVYEWLCGTTPFSGTFLQLAYQHRDIPPPPLREGNPSLPPAVEQVVLTALAKDPAQRFASVSAFAAALEQASKSQMEERPLPRQRATSSSPTLPTVPSAPLSSSGNAPIVASTARISGPFGSSAPSEQETASNRGTAKSSAYRYWRYLLWLTAILGALQGVLGLTMVAMGQKPGTGTGLYYLHYVYGGIVALAIPIVALTYTTGGKNLRRDLLILSIAALVLAAAGVRAWMTGPAVP